MQTLLVHFVILLLGRSALLTTTDLPSNDYSSSYFESYFENGRWI